MSCEALIFPATSNFCDDEGELVAIPTVPPLVILSLSAPPVVTAKTEVKAVEPVGADVERRHGPHGGDSVANSNNPRHVAVTIPFAIVLAAIIA